MAEDFPIMMNVIKNQIAELEMTHQCSFCYDGQEAINIAFSIIKTAIDDKATSAEEIRPIDLMILDFQMPRKNGLDVIKSVRRFIQNTKSDVKIIEPRFVFLTAYSTKAFRQYAR